MSEQRLRKVGDEFKRDDVETGQVTIRPWSVVNVSVKSENVPKTMMSGVPYTFRSWQAQHSLDAVKDKDGAHWVAPVYWNDEYKKWSYDGWRPYVQSCASCHVTGIKTAKEPWYQGQPPMPTTQPKACCARRSPNRSRSATMAMPTSTGNAFSV